MPLYDYECPACGARPELFAKIKDKPATVPCPKCQTACASIVVLGHGGIQSDSPSWLLNDPTVRGCLQDPSEKPIESRVEYRKHLAQRGIVERT
jgi:putative FmdB family regulatory protein